VLCFIVVLPLAAPAMAGQGPQIRRNTAGHDNSGPSCRAVRVTATSPALQVPSVNQCLGHEGEYRLSPLPIGTYTFLFSWRFPDVRREACG